MAVQTFLVVSLQSLQTLPVAILKEMSVVLPSWASSASLQLI